MNLALVLVDLQLLLAEFAFHVGQLLLLRLYEITQLAHAVVILKLVLGDDQAATLLAQHRSLRIVLALFEMRCQTVQFNNGVASVHDVVAIDAQPGQQVSQDSRNRSELRGRDGCTV